MPPQVNCQICDHGCASLFEKAGYSLFRCTHCKYLFVHPAPSPEMLKEYYQQDYYELDDERYLQTNQAKQDKWNRRLSMINRLLSCSGGSLMHKNILDVGCATGVFLQVAQRQGWDVYGIEHSEFAGKQAEKAIGKNRIHLGSLDDFQSNTIFSVITAWAILEHVNDPMSFLRKAYASLEDGGLLCLSTVNTSSLNYALFRKNWRYLIPPEHLSYFNSENLTMALRITGFEWLITDTKYNYLAFLDGISPQDRHVVRRVSPILKGLLYLPKMAAEHTGRGDTLEIWARKKAGAV